MSNDYNPKPPLSPSRSLVIPKENVVYSIIVSRSTVSALNLQDYPQVEEVVKCSNMCRPIDDNCSSGSKYGCAANGYRKKAQERAAIESCSSLDDSDEEFVDAYEYEDNSDYQGMKPTRACRQNSKSIKSRANSIYIALHRKASMTDSGWINICRICHGGKSIGDLLAPCYCRGSVGLAHMCCLERWLKESSSSRCELCNYHFTVLRRPKYNVPVSILMFLRHPGDHLPELVLDLLAFSVYTPSALVTSYMMMVLLEQIAHNRVLANTGASTAHVVAFTAVFGLATIDFTYSSWLMICLQKHFRAWKDWYQANSELKIILPDDPQPSETADNNELD